MRKFYFIILLLSLVWVDSAQAQTVQFVGRKLRINNQPFLIKGINSSLFPIKTFWGEWGLCFFDPAAVGHFTCPWASQPAPRPTIEDLDFLVDPELAWTAVLNGNTYRTVGQFAVFPSPMLQRANQHGVKVIAGYWIDYNLDFTFPSTQTVTRQQLINDFVSYMNSLRNDPNYSAVLMIGLSNEVNDHFCDFASNATVCVACDRDVQARGFYSLMDDMARLGKAAITDPRPVIIVSGELGDVGNANRLADDASLPNVDGWGINAYRGNSFGNLFAVFASLSQKPMVLTEFGMDAWNSNPTPASPMGGIDEATQDQWVGLLWDEIKAQYLNPNGVAAGGVVFQLTDKWWPMTPWKRSVSQHNTGGWENPYFPDEIADEEFWGLCDRRPGPVQFLDSYVPRAAAFTIRTKFGQP